MSVWKSSSAIGLTGFLALSTPGLAQAAKANVWDSEIAPAIQQGRCADAEAIALKAYDVGVAEQALRLCRSSAQRPVTVSPPPRVQPQPLVLKPAAPAPVAPPVVRPSAPPPVATIPEAKPPEAKPEAQTAPPEAKPVVVQTPTPAPISVALENAERCEVHIWVNTFVNYADLSAGTFTGGGLLGGLLSAEISREKAKTIVPKLNAVLTQDFIVEAIKGARSGIKGDAAPLQYVVESGNLEEKAYDKVSGRSSPSTSKCYEEIFVRFTMYMEQWPVKPKVVPYLTLKSFGADGRIEKAKPFKLQPLTEKFPAPEDATPEARESASAALETAYRQAVAKILEDNIPKLRSRVARR